MAKSSLHNIMYRVAQALMCWLMKCEITTYLCAEVWHYSHSFNLSMHAVHIAKWCCVKFLNLSIKLYVEVLIMHA